ncbi:MAG: hypothetical protein GQF41_1859 [Candidatus Rifleibacterium amylolyticum]|nr:MAG: hypothetical protein GQF41_1859 [Candidatus Rifleibacterium amylolyticum]
MQQQTHSPASEPAKIRLDPLPFWKWSIAIFLLLVIPLGILFQQASVAFDATADMVRNDIGQQVDGLASRIALELDVNTQLREIINRYDVPYTQVSERLYYISHFRRLCKIPLPVAAANALNGLEAAHRKALAKMERRLRRLIPGIKLLRWDNQFNLLPESDETIPRWAYKLVVVALKQRLTRTDKNEDRSYLDNIPMLARNFLDTNKITMFIRSSAEVYEFSDASGRRIAMYWNNNKVYGFRDNYESGGGFLAIVDLEQLGKTFAFDMIRLRKRHEWESAGIEPGWLISPQPGQYYLPYPFSALDQEYWARWLYNRPNGIHEHRGIIVSIKRVPGSVMLVTARSAREVDAHYRRSIFMLILLVSIALILPIIVVLSCRKNQGMALSIRWQIVALFVLAMALPSAVLFHLGGELLKDRQRIYEQEAFQTLEGLKKNIEENTDYAFHYVETLGNELGSRLMKLELDDRGRPVEPGQARSIIGEYADRADLTAVYMLDSSSEMIFNVALDRSTGTDIIALVQALAKIKLRYTGNLKLRGKASDLGMVDLFIEASGGVSVEAIQSILKYRENKAFEFRFSNRRICFFVGEFSPPHSDESYIIVVVLKDANFERMLMRLMIDNHENEAKYRNRVQLFFGSNISSGDSYFRPANISAPWFDYLVLNEETIRVGRLSESTRFSGVAVKDRIELQNSGRKCLFYSFRPSNLDMHSVVALHDYSEIDYSLSQLRIFIIVSFLVSLLIGYILARVMARSLIEPVHLLQQGVERVESGDYRTLLEMPGQDELVELAESFNSMTHGLDERERMTRYLSKSAVKAVESGEDAYMGGKKVPATVLFSDIRSFTTISESNPAEVVVSLLNDYFAVMNAVVEEHGGDIDKFIGDAIMALFIAADGDSEPRMQALNAVRCALNMMRALADFNADRAARGLFPIMIGVGINSGEVIAGNIGSPGRMDRTVIGDTVNVASRLEGMSKLGRHTHVIISRSTLEMVSDLVEVEQLAETSVKGKTSAVEMFEVISIKSYN